GRGRGGGRGRGRRGRRVSLGGGGIALSASRQGQRPHQHRQPSRHGRLPVVLEPVAGALAQTASLVPQASRKERQRFWVSGSRKYCRAVRLRWGTTTSTGRPGRRPASPPRAASMRASSSGGTATVIRKKARPVRSSWK